MSALEEVTVVFSSSSEGSDSQSGLQDAGDSGDMNADASSTDGEGSADGSGEGE